jgi:hypothetical protein
MFLATFDSYRRSELNSAVCLGREGLSVTYSGHESEPSSCLILLHLRRKLDIKCSDSLIEGLPPEQHVLNQGSDAKA